MRDFKYLCRLWIILWKTCGLLFGDCLAYTQVCLRGAKFFLVSSYFSVRIYLHALASRSVRHGGQGGGGRLPRKAFAVRGGHCEGRSRSGSERLRSRTFRCGATCSPLAVSPAGRSGFARSVDLRIGHGFPEEKAGNRTLPWRGACVPETFLGRSGGREFLGWRWRGFAIRADGELPRKLGVGGTRGGRSVRREAGVAPARRDDGFGRRRVGRRTSDPGPRGGGTTSSDVGTSRPWWPGRETPFARCPRALVGAAIRWDPARRPLARRSAGNATLFGGRRERQGPVGETGPVFRPGGGGVPRNAAVARDGAARTPVESRRAFGCVALRRGRCEPDRHVGSGGEAHGAGGGKTMGFGPGRPIEGTECQASRVPRSKDRRREGSRFRSRPHPPSGTATKRVSGA